ncbi:hypothetical protein [uncultured Vibrio sp.]|uniref:hypothetical protein n=1 Tax=uncultured Vibrio sp. TaxID=114054 RepID=UPI0025D08954|nr:hypothetical protein [uncultured Vibrio sp.]
MSDRLKRKRISYSILLDPQNNAADLYASKVLHQWAERLTKLSIESESDDSLALHEARNIHKNVYLSGLFLHLMNPELSQQLSAQLTESQISEFTLVKTLQGTGYLQADNAHKQQHNEVLDKIQALEKAVARQVTQESDKTRELLNVIAETSTKPEEIAGLNVDSEIIMATKGQNDHLIELVNSQAKELADLKSMLANQSQLIQSLTQRVANGQVSVAQPQYGDDNSPVIDLNERLAHVQRAKKKGIF